MSVEKAHEAVRRLCEGWATMSREEFHEVMTDDCDYRNIPIEGDRHTGPDEAHDILCRFRDKWAIDLKVVNLTGDDKVVMAERTETFEHRAGAKPTFTLPVMGTFEVRDGKVSAWRDYFEMSHMRMR